MSIIDTDDWRTLYALTWRDKPGGLPMYWSLRCGWTFDSNKAWVLNQTEVNNIEADEYLQNRLPQYKERKDGANWEPIYRRIRPGVTDDLFSTLVDEEE